MRFSRGGGFWLLISMLLLSVTVFACKKTPEDVRKWAKDRRAAAKMKEFILGENSPEVKLEAMEILVERGEANNLVAIMPKLPESEREALVDEMIKRLDKLLDSETFGTHVRAKDGVYYLANAGVTEAQRSRLHELLLKWADGDNFWCPLDRVGNVDQSKLFEEVGADGIPVFEKILRGLFAELAEAQRAEASLHVQQKILEVLHLMESLNLPEMDEVLARFFVAAAEEAYPNLAEIYGHPFLKNKSPLLVPLAEKIMLDPDYRNDALNILRDILLRTYYVDVQLKEGGVVCGKVLRDDRSGFLRWMCVRYLMVQMRAPAVDLVFTGLPDDPAALALPEDHPLASSFDVGRYFWVEAESYCRSMDTLLGGKVPLDKIRNYLNGSRMVERLLAVLCLSFQGEAADMERLLELSKDRSDISAWDAGVATLGEFALMARAAHAERKAEAAAAEQGAGSE